MKNQIFKLKRKRKEEVKNNKKTKLLVKKPENYN